MGLRKTDFDLDVGLVHVRRSVSLIGARQVVKTPKTAAGLRTVALPMWLVPEVEKHFIDYAAFNLKEMAKARDDGSSGQHGSSGRGSK